MNATPNASPKAIDDDEDEYHVDPELLKRAERALVRLELLAELVKGCRESAREDVNLEYLGEAFQDVSEDLWLPNGSVVDYLTAYIARTAAPPEPNGTKGGATAEPRCARGVLVKTTNPLR